MRLAVYNVENLFDRAKVMNLDSWEEGRETLEDFAALNRLLGAPAYTTAMKAEMVALLLKLGLEKSDLGPFVILRRNRGGLLRRPRAGGMEITADGRGDWVGSLELRDEPVNEHAMRNTARVIRDLGADVLGMVEAEHRPALLGFNDVILPLIGGAAFSHVMVIDGNDDRGIDVGLMTAGGFPIGSMMSHVDDRAPNGQRIFSRDCPEFEVGTPQGNTLTVMVNHLKSKGYGSTASSDARRRLQADRVKEIYEGRISAGARFVAIIGDLNDTPSSRPLRSLIEDTDLTDIFMHPQFDDGGWPGTYGLSNASNKIDYMLLSPDLYARVKKGGVFRKGMWPGSRRKRWESYPEVSRPHEAASDHAAIWADIDI